METTRSEARSFWIIGSRLGEIRTEILPEPRHDEVLVRTLFTGISRGTEALVFCGGVPESEYRRMRAPFQAGDFPAPVKYGYASVGRVDRGPHGVEGRNVFVLYPHQTRYVVPARSTYLLPERVPPERAILAANLETAINGLWDARPHVGDRIAVVGAGAVGCLTAWLARQIAACDVQLIDVNPERRAIAAKLGVSFATPEQAAEHADVVIHA